MTKSLISIFCRSLRLALLALASVAASAQESNDDIYGTWKITAVRGAGFITLTDAEEQKLIGKIVIISSERFEFNGKVCLHPDYKRRKEDPSTYFYEGYRADLSDIPFPSPVTEIDTGSPHCNFLYPIQEDHLMIAEGGSFFEAVRIGKVSNESGQGRKQ